MIKYVREMVSGAGAGMSQTVVVLGIHIVICSGIILLHNL